MWPRWPIDAFKSTDTSTWDQRRYQLTGALNSILGRSYILAVNGVIAGWWVKWDGQSGDRVGVGAPFLRRHFDQAIRFVGGCRASACALWCSTSPCQLCGRPTLMSIAFVDVYFILMVSSSTLHSCGFHHLSFLSPPYWVNWLWAWIGTPCHRPPVHIPTLHYHCEKSNWNWMPTSYRRLFLCP